MEAIVATCEELCVAVRSTDLLPRPDFDSVIGAWNKLLPQSKTLTARNTIGYSVENKTDEYEERCYPASTWVCTTVSSIYQDTAKVEGFRRLQSYAQGHNDKGAYLSIHPPILTRLSTQTGEGFDRKFVISTYLCNDHLDGLPRPENPDVYLEQLPEMTVFVRTFQGIACEEKWTYETKRLAEVLRNKEDIRTDIYFTASYESPYQLVSSKSEIWFVKYDRIEDSRFVVKETSVLRYGEQKVEISNSVGSCTFVYQETMCLHKGPRGANFLHPGQKFFVGCKKCVCGPFGKIMCTRGRCKQVFKQRPSIPPYRRFITRGFVSPGSRDPRRGQGFKPLPMVPNRSRHTVAKIQKNKAAAPKVWLVNSRTGSVDGGFRNNGRPIAPPFNSLRMPPMPPISPLPAIPPAPSMQSGPSMPPAPSIPPLQTKSPLSSIDVRQRGPADVIGGSRLGGPTDTGIPQLLDQNLNINAGSIDFPPNGVPVHQADISQQMSIDFIDPNQTPTTGRGTSLTQFVDILNRNNFVGNTQSFNNPPVPDFGQGTATDFIDPGLTSGITDFGMSQVIDAQVTGPGLGFGTDIPPLAGNPNTASGVTDPNLTPVLDSFNSFVGGPNPNPSVWDQAAGPSMMDIAMNPILMDNMVDPFELGQSITSNIKDSPVLMAHLLSSNANDHSQGQHSHVDPFSGTGIVPPSFTDQVGTQTFTSPIDPLTPGSQTPSSSGGGHFHAPKPTVPSPPVIEPTIHGHPQAQAQVMNKPGVSPRIM
ncbi:hypothetical protein ACF0H5_001538 [Mactra antiquata]